MTQRIPIQWHCPFAMKKGDAAKALGIGQWKMWQLIALGRIKTTSYGTIPVSELERHLQEELEGANSNKRPRNQC